MTRLIIALQLGLLAAQAGAKEPDEALTQGLAIAPQSILSSDGLPSISTAAFGTVFTLPPFEAAIAQNLSSDSYLSKASIPGGTLSQAADTYPTTYPGTFWLLTANETLRAGFIEAVTTERQIAVISTDDPPLGFVSLSNGMLLTVR